MTSLLQGYPKDLLIALQYVWDTAALQYVWDTEDFRCTEVARTRMRALIDEYERLGYVPTSADLPVVD